jgi:hypothetical protein
MVERTILYKDMGGSGNGRRDMLPRIYAGYEDGKRPRCKAGSLFDVKSYSTLVRRGLYLCMRCYAERSHMLVVSG